MLLLPVAPWSNTTGPSLPRLVSVFLFSGVLVDVDFTEHPLISSNNFKFLASSVVFIRKVVLYLFFSLYGVSCFGFSLLVIGFYRYKETSNRDFFLEAFFNLSIK